MRAPLHAVAMDKHPHTPALRHRSQKSFRAKHGSRLDSADRPAPGVRLLLYQVPVSDTRLGFPIAAIRAGLDMTDWPSRGVATEARLRVHPGSYWGLTKLSDHQ